LTKTDEGQLDAAVVSQLYAHYAEPLRFFLLGLLRDPHLAGDVVQETFVKLSQRGREVRPRARKAWLYRVAYHEALALRRRDGIGQRALTELAWTADTDAEPAESLVVRRQTVDAVRQALDELPPPQRRIVQMRIYENKTFAAIAEQLDIPLGTALGRMRLATEKLRRRLAEIGANP